MYEQGYIKLHRSLLTWEWYDDANTLRLFLHLLLTVNHKDADWQGVTIQRGQRVCSLYTLAEETGLSVQNIRTALTRLKSTHEITQCSNRKYSVVTVNNYNLYQDDNTDDNTQPTHSQHTTKKDKNLKEKEIYKEKEKSSKEPLGEFGKVLLSEDEQSRLVQRLGKDKAKDYIDRLDGWLAEGNAKKNHYATILNWWRKDEKEKGRGAKWL